MGSGKVEICCGDLSNYAYFLYTRWLKSIHFPLQKPFITFTWRGPVFKSVQHYVLGVWVDPEEH